MHLLLIRPKLFRSARSQAVSLPARRRFEDTEMEVERDPQTGVVSLRLLLSSPLEWLLRRAALLDQDSHPADGCVVFMQRHDVNGPPNERDWPRTSASLNTASLTCCWNDYLPSSIND